MKKSNISQKTSRWQSAVDLEHDPSFPMYDSDNINRKLAKFQHELPGFIQKRQSARGQLPLCLHIQGRKIFMEKAGIKHYPLKTKEWLAASDLIIDKAFPTSDNVAQKLQDLQSEMPDVIQMRKPKTGAPCLCLHRKAYKEFIAKAGITKYLPKTVKWLSANDLIQDDRIPLDTTTAINSKLVQMQRIMPDLIQTRKPPRGRACLCLRRDAVETFIEEMGLKHYPQKTSDWQSASDLKDVFNMNYRTIAKTLKKLRNQMPEFIQMRKSKTGAPCLCLHRTKHKEFLDLMRRNKKISMQKASKLVSLLTSLIQSKKNKKTDNSHSM